MGNGQSAQELRTIALSQRVIGGFPAPRRLALSQRVIGAYQAPVSRAPGIPAKKTGGGVRAQATGV